MLAVHKLLIDTAPCVYYAVSALGAIFVLYQLFILMRGLFTYFFRKRQNFA
jgi:hypothetical protein